MSTPAPCSVCSKSTESECSHIDCPNRRLITAQPVGALAYTLGSDASGFPLPGRAIVRKPRLFDE